MCSYAIFNGAGREIRSFEAEDDRQAIVRCTNFLRTSFSEIEFPYILKSSERIIETFEEDVILRC